MVPLKRALIYRDSTRDLERDLEGYQKGLLGGSWLVISGVISRVTIGITHIRGLMTPLITTHEPPSRVLKGLLYGQALCYRGRWTLRASVV